jgi:uncharacterized OB-fold protein
LRRLRGGQLHACRELQAMPVDGRGLIYSWTVVHRAATPIFETPYAPAIVTMDEGYQMLTNIIGANTDELRVGLAVQVDFREVSDGLWLPYFRPVE